MAVLALAALAGVRVTCFMGDVMERRIVGDFCKVTALGESIGLSVFFRSSLAFY